MLSLLVPSASAARAPSRLARRLQVSMQKPRGPPHRRASTSIGQRSHTAYTEEDTDDVGDRPRSSRSNTDFSHFFDKRVSALSRSLVASHEIHQASRHAVNAFREAIGTRSPADIMKAYHRLIQAHRRHAEDVTASSSRTVKKSEIGFPLRKGDLQTAIRYLVQHAETQGYMEPHLVEACISIFQDMGQNFGFKMGPTDLHRQLQACCLSNLPQFDPCKAFAQLRKSYPDWQTTSVEWNLVISYLVEHRAYGQAIEMYQEMIRYGVEPEEQLRNTMIRAYLATNNTAEANLQLQSISAQNRQLGIDTLTTTVHGLCKIVSLAKEPSEEQITELKRCAGELRKAVESNAQGATDTAAWNALLRYEAIIAGPAHALETARQLSKPGLFDYSTLLMLLRMHIDELNDLHSSDEALDMFERIQSAIDPERTNQPDERCYIALMRSFLDSSSLQGTVITLEEEAEVVDDETRQPRALPTPNQIRECQLLYDHARSLGLPPTTRLVKPLLQAYCEAFLPSLPAATALVQDMLDYLDPAIRRESNGSARNKVVIGMNVIGPVLDACIKLKDIASARYFLSRLHDAGITINAENKTHLTCRLFGIATTWHEAFQIYRTLSRFSSSSSDGKRFEELEYKGCTILLDTFRSLSFPDSSSQTSAAPPQQLLRIVSDMRAAGHKPSCSIYTSILDYYSKIPEPSGLGVRLTHEVLKRDEDLEPDLPLINALMNGYNRTDEPAKVLAIWDSLVATRQEIDGITLSVLFDTAGQHGLLSVARKAINTVRRLEQGAEGTKRSAMTKGAWDSWLECLARCGRLEEAIELAFGEMRRTLFREAIALHDLNVSEEVSVTELVARSTQSPIRDKKGLVIGPDAKTLGTLMAFAARERDRRQKRLGGSVLPMDVEGGSSIWHTLRSRIREELSWIYPAIRRIGENPL